MNQVELLPRYKCHKEVSALKIKKVVLVDTGDFYHFELHPLDNHFPPVIVASAWHDKHKPHAGGYYVVYEDGYHSFSPAKAFEEGYSLLFNPA